MGAVSELYAMQRSFSADRTVKHQSRSGDDQDGGAVVLDFVAQAQSAEADIIEAEERAELQESKRKFAALLRAYFKRILTADEYRFLVGCIRQNKTLYQVGRALGVNANKTAESIESKCKASEKQFFFLMSYSGYDCRRGCEFMARLFNPDAHRRKVRDKIQARREKERLYAACYFQRHKQERAEYKRKYRALNPEKKREEDRRYREANRIKIRTRETQGASGERHRARVRAYDAAHKEEKRERMRIWREFHRAELRAKAREYRARKHAERAGE